MIHEMGLLNSFDSPLQTKSTFVQSKMGTTSQLLLHHGTGSLPGAYRVYGMTFWPPGDVVHAAQSIKPALRSVNEGLSIEHPNLG